MGRCSVVIREVRFVIEDELTHCFVAADAIGDCPLGVQGWHSKTFPASTSIQQIVNEHVGDYLKWPQQAPSELAPR